MKISVFGLGYVGAVTAGCLAQKGHSVVGVDVSQAKVEMLNRGEAPIIEPGLESLLQEARARGLLRATTEAAAAVAATEASFVCVGTPSSSSGAIDLRFVRQVTLEIAAAMRSAAKPHALVFRSTMLPGSTASLVADCLAERPGGGRASVFFFPEFLREGTAVEDFRAPSLSVVGTSDGLPPSTEWAELFGSDPVTVSWGEAEMVKYACNAFHALKVTFANEVGRLGKQLNIDAAGVMRLVCRDTKLNVSPLYLRPGNPFGGSCLPKDLRALVHFSRQQGIPLPLLENLLPSNEHHFRSLLHLVENSGRSEVVILGLSFKPNTDDLRESAMVEVAQNLLGRGYQVRIFDPQLNLAELMGSNKRLIDSKMPHLASLLHSDLRSALGSAGIVLAAQKCASIDELAKWVTTRHHILDINGWPELRSLAASYEGLCW